MVLPPMVGEAPRPGYGDLKPIIVSLHPLGCQRRKTGFSSVHPAVESGIKAFLPGGTTELPCGRAPGACNAGLKPLPGRHPIDDRKAFGAFLDRPKHWLSLSESVRYARGPRKACDA